MANSYRLMEDGELIGTFTILEIAKMLEVTTNTAYDAYNKGRPIKKHFTIEPPEEEKEIPTEGWVTDMMAEWDETRRFLNPKLDKERRERLAAAIKKTEKKERKARRSVRYSSSAVRFR